MSKKVLVVDDSATVRKSVCFLLAQAGYQPMEADDGTTAVGYLNSKLDLIITDLKKVSDLLGVSPSASKENSK